MKEVLIINALFFKGKAKSNMLSSRKFKHFNAKEIYLRNSFVSLFSAKSHLPNANVMLVTNEPLSSEWEAL